MSFYTTSYPGRGYQQREVNSTPALLRKALCCYVATTATTGINNFTPSIFTITHLTFDLFTLFYIIYKDMVFYHIKGGNIFHNDNMLASVDFNVACHA